MTEYQTDRLKTEILVTATLRQIFQAGGAASIMHRGNLESGTILICRYDLAGKYFLYQQVRLDEALAWQRLNTGEDYAAVQAKIAQSLAFDPDVWVIELEEREERLWFPGAVV